jgi:hypothetical protein
VIPQRRRREAFPLIGEQVISKIVNTIFGYIMSVQRLHSLGFRRREIGDVMLESVGRCVL